MKSKIIIKCPIEDRILQIPITEPPINSYINKVIVTVTEFPATRVSKGKLFENNKFL